MAVTFAVRGTSFTAAYSPSKNQPIAKRGGKALASVPIVEATTGAGIIGNSIINLDRGVAASGNRFVSWPADGNLNTGLTRSILLRAAVGSVATTQGLVTILSGGLSNNLFAFWLNSDDTVTIRVANEYGTTIFQTATAWLPTVDTYYDIFFQWDGTTNANRFKFYVDGTLKWQATAPIALSAPNDNLVVTDVMLGSNYLGIGARLRVNEFVIWDNYVDPTAATLTSGVASLNGAARSAFVDVPLLDGSSFVDPGVANVLSSTGYTFAGVSMTGTYHNLISVDPGIANVLSSTGYTINDVSLTGTYHNPVYTNPGATNVLSGTGYTFNDSSFTGSLAVPTYSDPGISNVRLATNYIYSNSTLTGTMSVPTPDSGAAGTVDLNGILETLRYILFYANTTTGSPVDLSSGLTERVSRVLTVNPSMIPPQISFYPFVTCYVTGKTMDQKTISVNQLNAKKMAVITIEVVGGILNENFVTDTQDPADLDINYLMENIELTLRGNPNLNSKVTWQITKGVSYYSEPLGEQTQLRAGILTLEGTVLY